MESQVVFNVAVAISGALGGWVLKVIWDAIRTLDTDVKQLGKEMHNDFVRREDFKEATQDVKADMKEGFRRVEEMLGAVFKRLDSKVDKP